MTFCEVRVVRIYPDAVLVKGLFIMLMALHVVSNSRLVNQQFVWLPSTLKKLSCPGTVTYISVTVETV